MFGPQLTTWIDTLAGRVNRRARRARPAARRPLGVEALEAREVPATFTWSQTAPGAYDWNNPANWGGQGVPNAVGDVANLTAALTGNQTVRLNQPITVGALTVGSTGANGTFTVVANNGSLTFDSATGPALLAERNKGGDSLNTPITLNDPLTLSNDANAPLALGSAIGGAGVISATGAYTLTAPTTVGVGVTLAGTATFTQVPTLFSASYYDGALYEFDAETGALLAQLVAPNTASSLVGPAGLTVGPDGGLYISNQFANTVVRYDLRTQSLSTFLNSATLNAVAVQTLPPPPQGQPESRQFAPAGLRFGPDGDLYVSLNGGVTSSSGAVVRFDINNAGGALSYAGTNTPLAVGTVQPSGLTFGVGNDATSLFVSAATGNVVKIGGAITATPTVNAGFIAPGSGGLEFPAGLTFGSDGKLYVVDLGAFTGAGKILRYNSNGAFDTTFVAAGNGQTPGNLVGQFPSDALFDAQGRLLVANLGPNGPTTGHPHDFLGSVFRYGPTGTFLSAPVTSAQFPKTGPSTADTVYSGVTPSQLALLPAPALFVTGTLNPGGAGTPGTLTAGDVTFDSSLDAARTFLVALNGTTPGTGYGRLVSTGTVRLNNAILATSVGFAAPLGSTFTIVSAATVTGTFAGRPDGSTFNASGQTFRINYTATAVTLTRAQAPAFTSGTATTFYTGQTNTFQAAATGFPAPTFSLSGTLPAGVTFDTATGTFSGTPTQTGSFPVTITASNGVAPDATQSFTLTVNTGVAPAITSAATAVFTRGTGGTFTVTATGAPTPVLAETLVLPAGVTFDAASGVLTVGANTQNGVYSLRFTATNGLGQATQNFTLTVGTPPAFTTATATTFYTGKTNTFQVTAGGFPTPAFSTNSTLPAGVTLSAAGVLSGTPTETGTFPITVTATNAVGSAQQSFTLTVNAGVAPSILTNDSAVFTAGQGGTFTVTATGTPTPVLSETATLPSGVIFDPGTGQQPSAMLTVGANTPAGVYNLVFKADNGVGTPATQNFTLTVGTHPAFTSPNNQTFVVGTQTTFQVSASGVPVPAITLTGGTLPAGLTYDPTTRLLSGTPPAGTGGTYTLTFTAANVTGSTPQTFTLTVNEAPAFTSANSTTFALGQPGRFQVTATGFPAPTYRILPFGSTFSITPGIPDDHDRLPAGVTIDPNTGVLSGTPTESGQFAFIIFADNGSGSASQNFTLTVTAPPAFTSPAATTFFSGASNTFTVTTSGFPPATYAETGTLPAGVTLNPTTGVLSGTPTQAGTFPITITATNTEGSAVQEFVLTVNAGVAPAFTSANSATFSNGQGGTFTVTATGSPTPTLAVVSALPAGVTFDPATGVLSVAPSAAGGQYTVLFVANNGVGAGASQNFTLTINQAPAFTNPAATTFATGSTGAFTVTASGFPAPSLTLVGTLPAGVAFDPNTGVLSGTPAAGTGGVYPLTITATNAVGTATQSFTLTVNQPPAFTSPNQVVVTTGVGGTFPVTATGFPAPTLSAFSPGGGALPAGVTFDPATGTLSVAPSVPAGAYALVFQAGSAAGVTTQAVTLFVDAVPTKPITRLAVGGATDGSALVYDQTANGAYNGTPTATVSPFGNVGVEVRTAVADVNGDGFDDIILVTGPGVPTRFAVVSGKDNSTVLVAPTAPFAGSEAFTGGGFVAAGDFDRDGRAEVVVTADLSGGPIVVVFSLPASGGLTQRASFLGIDDDNFRGGARAAVGDVNGDGTPDLVVMAGFGGGPRVALFDGLTVFSAAPERLVNDFYAFEDTLRNGAYAAVGDVDGDGRGDLVFGAGPGGGPRVLAVDGVTLLGEGPAAAIAAPLANFFVNNDQTTRGGVRVATKAVSGGGAAVGIVTGAGEGDPGLVHFYPAATNHGAGEPAGSQTLDPFAQVLADGVFVG